MQNRMTDVMSSPLVVLKDSRSILIKSSSRIVVGFIVVYSEYYRFKQSQVSKKKQTIRQIYRAYNFL